MFDEQNIEAASIPVATGTTVSDSNEAAISSVPVAEDHASNPIPEKDVVTPVTAPESTDTNVPTNPDIFSTPPSPKKIFGAFDTTGAEVVAKSISDDKGQTLGDQELYSEFEAFLKKFPQYSSYFTATPTVPIPVTPESEGSVNE